MSHVTRSEISRPIVNHSTPGSEIKRYMGILFSGFVKKKIELVG